MHLICQSNEAIIFIDHLNKIKRATHFINENRTNIHISAVTRAEVLTGISEEYLLDPTFLGSKCYFF